MAYRANSRFLNVSSLLYVLFSVVLSSGVRLLPRPTSQQAQPSTPTALQFDSNVALSRY